MIMEYWAHRNMSNVTVCRRCGFLYDCSYGDRTNSKLIGGGVSQLVWQIGRPEGLIKQRHGFCDMMGLYSAKDYLNSWPDRYYKVMNFTCVMMFFLDPAVLDIGMDSTAHWTIQWKKNSWTNFVAWRSFKLKQLLWRNGFERPAVFYRSMNCTVWNLQFDGLLIARRILRCDGLFRTWLSAFPPPLQSFKM